MNPEPNTEIFFKNFYFTDSCLYLQSDMAMVKIENGFYICTDKPKHICCAYRCKDKRKAKNRFCARHAHRYRKIKDPVGYVYDLLKCNARRRGKPFTLTMDEFRQFCLDTDYMRLRGKTGKSASIDRIDNSKGYEIGNIRILSLSENSHKRNVEDYAPF